MKLSGAKVITFLVTADRISATAFYRDTLGLPVTHEDQFACVFDLGGTSLRLSQVDGFRPEQHTVLGWDVADIRETILDLRNAGIDFTFYEGMGQDELGIWSPPGSGTKVAWFKDPDGNMLSLTQFS